ncbi:hypothetical protein ACO34A_04580 [Rhizobium sp. ACO-34A]|nr:hypothetical protein [Rhizobium sp. ACO-34A]ATN33077.1 hypothetical protein ACO34A_04580 [Rhizobium sp. ACO-34A]
MRDDDNQSKKGQNDRSDDDAGIVRQTHELWRADLHERELRLAATLAVATHHCRIRKCRRDEGCSGPMVPSTYQAVAVEAQRMLGFSGDAVSRLPLCLAEIDETSLRRCMTQSSYLRQRLGLTKLPRYERRLRGRPWSRYEKISDDPDRS